MKLIPKKITRSIGKAVLKSKKNSPHIFFGLGLAGVVGGAVLACRATLKLEETVDEINNDLSIVKETKSRVDNPKDVYSDQDYYKDLGYVYGKATRSVVKLYGPAVLVGGIGIAALTGSHIQMTRRNAALMTSLAAVNQAYAKYRERMQEELGPERENDIFYGTDAVEERSDSDDSGENSDRLGHSIYAQFFDERNVNYQNDPELNRIFIQLQQNYFNYRLNAHGHVFLNEVYDRLGLERTTAGAVVGWVLNGDGDNYIDFGLNEERCAAFIDGYEKNVILDFNVDGVIYDLI